MIEAPKPDGEMVVLNSMRPFILAKNVVVGLTLIFGGFPANVVEVVKISPRSGGRIRLDVKLANGAIQGGTFRKAAKIGYQP